nr:DUF6512 family protein [Candidatus Sigynarchaeota archaeon]
MDKTILKWEMWGFIIAFVAGTLLHFTFEWTRNWVPIAVIAAVNESTWEHLKIAFWPMFIWACIEWKIFKVKGVKAENYVIGKAIGIYSTPLLIIAMFYSYLALGGIDSLAYDIGIFAASIFVGQVISALILSLKAWPSWTRLAGIIALIFAAACFSLFTYLPPQNILFLDPESGLYGIIP